MKITVGQKVLNLEELFLISTYSAAASSQIEVVVDSQIYAELDKKSAKDSKPVTEYPKKEEFSALNKEDARAILIVKVIQLLKLRSMCKQSLIDGILTILNDDKLPDGATVDFPGQIY